MPAPKPRSAAYYRTRAIVRTVLYIAPITVLYILALAA